MLLSYVVWVVNLVGHLPEASLLLEKLENVFYVEIKLLQSSQEMSQGGECSCHLKAIFQTVDIWNVSFSNDFSIDGMLSKWSCALQNNHKNSTSSLMKLYL